MPQNQIEQAFLENIVLTPTNDIHAAAKYTLDNMSSYYQRYSVDWQLADIVEKTKDLDNYDIVIMNKPAGVLRLQFDADCCYLRDLQVDVAYQNKGVGKYLLDEVKRMTLQAGHTLLKLRVFKISPAVRLYQRNGFVLESEDDRMLNLVAIVISQVNCQ